jgi:predicted esterase
VLAATQWNILAHDGFIRSFLSAIRYAPSSNQQTAWKRLAIQNRKILIFVASHDPIIFPEDLKPDVEELLLGTESKIEWRKIEGAHDFTNTHLEKIVEDISVFWRL